MGLTVEVWLQVMKHLTNHLHIHYVEMHVYVRIVALGCVICV